jgi:hypothetical protein
MYMLNSSVLDVAIGLVFVYLVLALLCTALNEWWSGQRGLRSKVLEEGIHKLLGSWPGDNALTKAFYETHLIQSITGPEGHPSYISPKVFAQALVETLQKLKAATVAPPKGTMLPSAGEETIEALVEQMADGPTKNALQTVLLGVDGTYDAALQRISNWFEDNMDRVSGWYKRRIQLVTLIMAALITLFTNADTLQIMHRLWSNPTLRAAVVARAQERAKHPTKPIGLEYKDPSPVATSPVRTTPDDADETNGKVLTPDEEKTLADLLSWSPELSEFNERAAAVNPAVQGQVDADLHVWNMVKNPGVFVGWLYWLVSTRLIGWMITIYAISLGAPFWFGALQKLVNIRSAGDAPDERKKASAGA